jgi:hypothetical protein
MTRPFIICLVACLRAPLPSSDSAASCKQNSPLPASPCTQEKHSWHRLDCDSRCFIPWNIAVLFPITPGEPLNSWYNSLSAKKRNGGGGGRGEGEERPGSWRRGERGRSRTESFFCFCAFIFSCRLCLVDLLAQLVFSKFRTHSCVFAVDLMIRSLLPDLRAAAVN